MHDCTIAWHACCPAALLPDVSDVSESGETTSNQTRGDLFGASTVRISRRAFMHQRRLVPLRSIDIHSQGWVISAPPLSLSLSHTLTLSSRSPTRPSLSLSTITGNCRRAEHRAGAVPAPAAEFDWRMRSRGQRQVEGQARPSLPLRPYRPCHPCRLEAGSCPSPLHFRLASLGEHSKKPLTLVETNRRLMLLLHPLAGKHG